ADGASRLSPDRARNRGYGSRGRLSEDKGCRHHLGSACRTDLCARRDPRPQRLLDRTAPVVPLDQGAATSSVHTLKLLSVFGPKVVVIATSAASRPRASSTRPMRGMLLRASKMYH